MQEDKDEMPESQPEPQEQFPSESKADEEKAEQVMPSSSESAAHQGQPAPQPRPAPIPQRVAPVQPPPTEAQKRWQFFLSLGFGFIPLLILLVVAGIAPGGLNGLGVLLNGFLVAVFLYIIELIITIVFLANKQQRFIGYGLLTAFLATPVIAAIGCTVISNLHR